MKTIRIALVFLCLLVLPSYVLSGEARHRAPGEPVTLSGFVHDKSNGEPLAYVNVMLKGTNLGGSTNVSGYFAIPNVPQGKYQIVVSIIGYATQTVDIILNDDVVRNFYLTTETVEVNGVTVEADRAERKKTVQTSMVILKPKDLEALPSIGETDLFRSLQMMPGVKAGSEISNGLYVRGGGPAENLILLDGTVVYNPSHLFGFFSTFNNDAIKDIELLKGGLPAEYGGRLSSVLNTTNKDGNRNYFEGKGSVSLISSRLTLEGPSPFGSWFLSARRTYLDLFIKTAGLDTGQHPIPLYYFYDANGKINFDFDQNNKLTLSGYLGKDDLKMDMRDDDITTYTFWGNRTGSLKYTHIFSSKLFSNIIATGSEYNSELNGDISGSKLLFQNHISDYSIRGDLSYYITDSHFAKL